jgi:hypothetical protein
MHACMYAVCNVCACIRYTEGLPDLYIHEHVVRVHTYVCMCAVMNLVFKEPSHNQIDAHEITPTNTREQCAEL